MFDALIAADHERLRERCKEIYRIKQTMDVSGLFFTEILLFSPFHAYTVGVMFVHIYLLSFVLNIFSTE